VANHNALKREAAVILTVIGQCRNLALNRSSVPPEVAPDQRGDPETWDTLIDLILTQDETTNPVVARMTEIVLDLAATTDGRRKLDAAVSSPFFTSWEQWAKRQLGIPNAPS